MSEIFPNPASLSQAFELVEAVYRGMPPAEYFNEYLDGVLLGMSPTSIDFFSAVTAVAAATLTILTEEQREAFFSMAQQLSGGDTTHEF